MAKASTNAAEDRELLRAVKRRDRQAFTRLYGSYHARLHGFLRRMLRDPRIVEEVLDDVMFVVWKDAGRFAGKSAVSSWIFGIAYRRAVSALRTETRHESQLDYRVDAEGIAAEPPRGRELVEAALARLSADHRQVIELTYYFGFSYREIAEIAACPVNTVKTRMFHARRRLQQLMPALAGEKEGQDREQA